MRFVYSFAIALAVLVVPAHAAVLNVGDVNITEGTTSVDMIVYGSGGDQVTSFATFIAVGDDPAAAFAGNVNAFITNVDNSQGIFGQSPAFDPFLGDGGGLAAGPTAGLVGADWTLFATNANSVTLNGSELFRFTVDTSGLMAGDSLNVTLDTESLTGQNPIFGLFGGGSSLATGDFTGTISVAPVPSPTSLAGLASLGLVGCGAAIRRRRRNA
ncbi:hypothetical protein Q31b_27170 [Novipirellula aureliae]|uniref:PEP-CTERM protein-sorting domain-containing protein n=1 Tax=Novipirellula aureliae TaxID=2527966 RepID=A0A5C6DX95_9BACT|nr:hypothetical protein [Novipirellula aureliae]TWU41278.1 hypothetical protein Q31b_27170 [Novipirellula aureliae]